MVVGFSPKHHAQDGIKADSYILLCILQVPTIYILEKIQFWFLCLLF